MLSTTGFQEENDCGINYFWRRLPQISPLNWTGWMVISQTVQAYVYCIHLLETLPSIFENSARGMLVQDLMPFTLSFWPFFFGHCLLSLFLLSCQVRATIRRASCQFTHEVSPEFDLLVDHGWELWSCLYFPSNLCTYYAAINIACVFTQDAEVTSAGQHLCLGNTEGHACLNRGMGNTTIHTNTQALSSLVVGTWSSQLCFYDSNIQLWHQDPCSRHMLVMSILTSAPCCCLQIVVSCCSHAHSVARVHV